jgi:hypothetical protein
MSLCDAYPAGFSFFGVFGEYTLAVVLLFNYEVMDMCILHKFVGLKWNGDKVDTV